MIRSLVVPEYYGSLNDFGSDIVNLLRQTIAIKKVSDKEVELENGLKLSKEEKFSPMSHRENLVIYNIKGKGEIGLDNPAAKVLEGQNKKVKKGGSLNKKRKELQNLLKEKYLEDFDSRNNVYVKKVVLHLKALMKHGVTASDLQCYLGNDEITDSYLLDMYCSKQCPKCFEHLYSWLSGDSNEKVNNLTFNNYVETKKQLLGEEQHNKNVSRSNNVFRNISQPIDIRTKIVDIYNGHKLRLGRDLFIVFCNITKDLWRNDRVDREDHFNNFCFLVSNIYTSQEVITNQDIDSAKDLTLYGNLLKSDVLNYKPQADFRNESDVNVPIVNSIPEPLELKLFSLCYLINKPSSNVSGGYSDPEIDELLSDL
jgi:hypothetical protein